MKTLPDNSTPAEILSALAAVAPSIAIETLWSHDVDLTDIREDCDGMEDEDPADWQAWQSEVCASCIVNGKTVSGSDYLGGTWEKACDHPAKSNPEISGYYRGMVREALSELGKQVEAGLPVQAEIEAALSIL